MHVINEELKKKRCTVCSSVSVSILNNRKLTQQILIVKIVEVTAFKLVKYFR